MRSGLVILILWSALAGAGCVCSSLASYDPALLAIEESDAGTANAVCGSCDEDCGVPSGAATGCSADEVCVEGACECLEGLVRCAERCVRLADDPLHCGACDTPCEDGVCYAGSCPADCGALTDCDGACADLSSDPLRCGACDTPCKPEEVCRQGVCRPECGNLADCDRACADTSMSVLHCGACNAPCAPGESCVDGACQ